MLQNSLSSFFFLSTDSMKDNNMLPKIAIRNLLTQSPLDSFLGDGKSLLLWEKVAAVG